MGFSDVKGKSTAVALRYIIESRYFTPFFYLGVAHSDDLQYFFETATLANIAAGSPDEAFSKKVVKLWVSFAYTGYDFIFSSELHALYL